MDTLLINFIQGNHSLQQLNPANGPTALTIAYTNLKIQLLELRHADADNLNYKQSWDLLNTDAMREFDSMLDRYGARNEEEYADSFNRLKSLVQQAVHLIG